MNLKKYIILISFLLLANLIFAQAITPSVISSGGGVKIFNSEIYYSYTIGQLIAPANSNGSLISQGFQQPVFVNSQNSDNIENEIQYNIFPNPIVDNFNITITSKEEIKDLKLSFYDIMGKSIILDYKIEKIGNISNFQKINVNVQNLKTGQYFINIIVNNQYNKSLKILKIK